MSKYLTATSVFRIDPKEENSIEFGGKKKKGAGPTGALEL
jgi:hypothetical protein